MLVETLNSLFVRDLTKLRQEIELYKDEKNIWVIEKNISNSAGNLCLHLVGNLNSFIGAQLGNTGYVRNRDLEFSLKDIPRNDLLKKIDETIVVVSTVLGKLNDPELLEEYPILVLAEKTTTGFFLVHLSTHLAYHVGQINYHRRLLDQ